MHLQLQLQLKLTFWLFDFVELFQFLQLFLNLFEFFCRFIVFLIFLIYFLLQLQIKFLFCLFEFIFESLLNMSLLLLLEFHNHCKDVGKVFQRFKSIFVFWVPNPFNLVQNLATFRNLRRCNFFNRVLFSFFRRTHEVGLKRRYTFKLRFNSVWAFNSVEVLLWNFIGRVLILIWKRLWWDEDGAWTVGFSGSRAWWSSAYGLWLFKRTWQVNFSAPEKSLDLFFADAFFWFVKIIRV